MDFKKLSKVADSEAKINDFSSFNPPVKNGGEPFQVGDFKCWSIPFVEEFIAKASMDPYSINEVGVILPHSISAFKGCDVDEKVYQKLRNKLVGKLGGEADTILAISDRPFDAQEFEDSLTENDWMVLADKGIIMGFVGSAEVSEKVGDKYVTIFSQTI